MISASFEREALTRFYAAGQSADQICRDLGITPEEFYRIKSRARNRFHELSNVDLHEGRAIASERNDGLGELEA
jgi:DNA primase large subunit